MRDARLSGVVAVLACAGVSGCVLAGPTAATPMAWVSGQNVPAFTDANGGAMNTIYPYKLELWGGAPLAGYSWTMTPGAALPVPGLVIDAPTGVVHGTLPDGFPSGAYRFSVTVSDGSTTADVLVDLDVSDCDSTPGGTTGGTVCPPVIGTFRAFGTTGSAGNLNAQLGLNPIPTAKALGFQVSAVGGVLPYEFRVASGALPPGVLLSASTGVLHGSADSSAAGKTYSFSVAATDGAGTPMVNGSAPGSQTVPYTMRF